SAPTGQEAPSRAGHCRRSHGHEGPSCSSIGTASPATVLSTPVSGRRGGTMRVGMIGLGNIGGHIANNLVADGHEVTVFDVDPARAAAIKGGETAASVAAVG